MGGATAALTGVVFCVGPGGRNVRIKAELGEKFQGAYGLSHEEPLATNVHKFIGNMTTCAQRRWIRNGLNTSSRSRCS